MDNPQQIKMNEGFFITFGEIGVPSHVLAWSQILCNSLVTNVLYPKGAHSPSSRIF